jgi:hypothetical protein
MEEINEARRVASGTSSSSSSFPDSDSEKERYLLLLNELVTLRGVADV